MERNFKQNFVAFFSFFLVAAFFAGCIAAVPVVIHYESTQDGYVATAEVDESPDEIWRSTTQTVEERVREGRLRILERDDSDRLIKVTDDVQTAEVNVDTKDGGGSIVVVKADVPDEKDEKAEEEKEKELALRIMKNICENAKADCELVEK